jgi:3-methyl-2-oxobutanoate hydroxymethyltransferase
VALELSGCFAVVLEAIPAAVAAHITEAVRIPTIGIGAGAACSGQVLVWHDLLGLTEVGVPRFVKRYADLSTTITSALEAYAEDVRRGGFPDETHTYGMPEAEREQMDARLGAPKAK